MVKKDLKRLRITCGDEYFYQRYIACLIIHGQSMQQAFRTYIANVETWTEIAYEKAEKKIEGSISVQDMQRLLNICYIEAMAESIETWIQCLMKETGKTRSEIEVLISVTLPKTKTRNSAEEKKAELKNKMDNIPSFMEKFTEVLGDAIANENNTKFSMACSILNSFEKCETMDHFNAAEDMLIAITCHGIYSLIKKAEEMEERND